MKTNTTMRRSAAAWALCGMLALTATAAHGQVINEIRIDQSGADNDDYFELFGPANASLDGLTYLVIGDGSGSGTIEAVVPLTGLSLDGNGFFVAAEATLSVGTANLTTSLNFENGDNVTHLLVDGFAGSNGQDLDTNDDGVLDVTPWTSIVSLIALIEEENPPSGTEYHYGPPTVGPDSTFVPGHVKLCPDGSTTWVIGLFDILAGSDTPGSSNDCGGTTPTPLPIYAIQGASHTSPHVGTLAGTSGIVTAVTAVGFYLQDPTGDGDSATSDGIFVFTGTAPTIAVGDAASVEGVVAECTPGGTGTGNLSITELTNPVVTINSSGNPLPAPTTISAADLPSFEVITDDGTVPFDPENDPLDFYETFEGMRVQVLNPLVVGARDRFDEIIVLADGGAGATGLNARGSLALSATDNNPERIELQIRNDLLGGFDPTVNVGDALSTVVGVVHYEFGFFEVRLTDTFTVTPGGLAAETSALVPTPSAVTIASYNVLNLDPVLENPALCNDGIDDIDDDEGDGRFAAIAGHIVNNLNAPDIVGLQEIQDGNGCENTGLTDGAATYNLLIDNITASGGPTYAFAELTPVDLQDGGQPGGNIRNGYLYNPARVSLAGPLERILDSNLADGDAFQASRKPLLARFDFAGETITIINIHSSSKGGSTPLFGAVFPPVNGREDQRAAQAAEINLAVDAELAAFPDRPVIVLGDHNEFEWTASVFDALTGAPSPVLEVLTRRLPDNERHTFTFNGNAQALDHIAISNGASAAAEYDIVHVNSEFSSVPSRGSDHEPMLLRLMLGGPDTDGDGVSDALDNCVNVANPDQRDSNGDGFGNICDADLNNDCIVNPIDLGIFKGVFFTPDADADLNGDGVVNPVDLGIFKSLFFLPPGPNGSGTCP